MLVCFNGPRIYLFALSGFKLWGSPSVTLLCVLRIDVWHKLSSYRPGQAPWVQDVEASRIYRQSAHGDDQFVSPSHRPPLTRRDIPGTHFCSKLGRPQGHIAAGRIKSVNLSGIEPATFPLVAQCLNELRLCVPAFGIRPYRHPRSGWKNNSKMYVRPSKFIGRKWTGIKNTKQSRGHIRMLMLVALSLPVLGVVDVNW
jgi:hypothetical protein